MIRTLSAVLFAMSLTACPPAEPDVDEGEDAGSSTPADAGSTADAGPSDPICHVVITGAVTATLDCAPSVSSSFAKIVHTKVGTVGTAFALTVPTAGPATGTQLNVSLQTVELPTSGMTLTQAGGTVHAITVIKKVGGTTERQWAVFKAFPGQADQGTFTLNYTALRQDEDTAQATTWSPTGSLSAHAPVVPAYGGSDSVDIQVTFRPRT
jgi:hypothetical protein